MEEKDGDTWYCYYAVMKLHYKPSEFAFLPVREKALLCTFIDQRLKEEEKEKNKIKSTSSGVKRGRRR